MQIPLALDPPDEQAPAVGSVAHRRLHFRR